MIDRGMNDHARWFILRSNERNSLIYLSSRRNINSVHNGHRSCRRDRIRMTIRCNRESNWININKNIATNTIVIFNSNETKWKEASIAIKTTNTTPDAIILVSRNIRQVSSIRRSRGFLGIYKGW
jgi:hypothetical protein